MDQDAFRALLSTPSASGSSRRLIQSSRGGGRLAVGGSTSSRTHTDRNQSEAASDSKLSGALKPRKFKSKTDDADQKKDKEAENAYRDRASERRQGKAGDFAEAEHLLEDFQARVAAAGDKVDRDLLEQQTKYLGGDERHTILVKGLDHALLQRRKAELSVGGQLGQVTDDDLEAAFEETERLEPGSATDGMSREKAQSSSHSRSHRDELVARLKSSRSKASNSVPIDLAVVDQLKVVGKFKPIGSSAPNPAELEALERKERKKRKKEKKLHKAAKLADADANKQVKLSDDQAKPVELLASTDSPKLPTAQSHTISSGALRPSSNPKTGIDSRPTSSKPAQLDAPKSASATTPSTSQPSSNLPPSHIEEDDIDIFGDAGDYKPFGEDLSDNTDDETAQPEAESKLSETKSWNTTFKRKNYFEDDPRSDEPEQEQEALQPSNTSVATKMVTQLPNELTGAGDEESDQQESSGHPTMITRLEGLSGSADIRSLLAADAAQEKEEKRKAKKLKKSETVKVLTDKDKLNRDVMEMERYLQKKKSGGNPAANLADRDK